MSAHMKKLLTKIVIGEREFKVPKKEANAVLALVESISSKAVSSKVVFQEHSMKRPPGAVYLRGLRFRENISQQELYELTGIPVSNISKLENGSRKITKNTAKKLAKALKSKERMFLA